MSQKRHQPLLQQDDGCSSDDMRRKSPRNAMREVMKFRNLQQHIVPVLEPLIRKIVKEEVDLAVRRHMNCMNWDSSSEEMQPPDSKNLQLQFSESISLPVFTGSRIEGDQGTAMKVTLVDAVSGQVVTRGPTSSANVEIVVLEGDFDGNEVGEIFLTDNSSWTRSRKFRLGARVVDNKNGIRVREAKTESFIVRDHRGELYKKHHPPCLSDEVWRLEKISKDGAFHKRLSAENVTTVKDFLTLLFLDPAKLRDILGPGMSAKMWEVTVDHARTCELGRKVHLYWHTAEKKSAVVFNVVGQVTGMLIECQYVSSDKLSEIELAEAQRLVILAFKQWEEVTSYDDETFLVDGFPLLSDVYHPTNSSPMAESSNIIDISSLDSISIDYPQLNFTTPDIMPSIYSIGCSSTVDEYGIHLESINSRFDQSMIFPNRAAESLISDLESFTPAPCDEHLQYLDTDSSLQNASLGSQSDKHGMVDGFIYAHSAAAVAIVKAHRRWIILFSVLRWFSILRIVAKKSM
ncbi:Calmodulin-binding protein 60 a [Heracleum sosnowskyi]|uniref:Calmodulin-binding protein 60 a n=1 Tax=Heracleum sosnowskyi TaxID=360622 RepID=A0AAD8HBA5_9APIA|nr:Calmodulin-binding protein 60 a [Heracleum sosnowskyi]